MIPPSRTAHTSPNLHFERYQLTVTARGFQNEIYESTQVQTGRATEIRTSLKVGGATETVQVVAE